MRRGQSVFLGSTFSQLPLAQNNPYVKRAYFGIVYSEPLHVIQESYDLGFQTCSYNCPGQEWYPGHQDPLESQRCAAAMDPAEQCR